MERIKKVIKQSVILKEDDGKFNIVPNKETSYSFKVLLTNKPHNIGLMDPYSKYYFNIFLIIQNPEEDEEYGFYGDIKIFDGDDEHIKTIYVSEYGGLSDYLNIKHLIDNEETDINFLNKNIISPDLSNEKEYYLDFQNLSPIRKKTSGWGLTGIVDKVWSFDLNFDLYGNITQPPKGFSDGNVINVFIMFDVSS